MKDDQTFYVHENMNSRSWNELHNIETSSPEPIYPTTSMDWDKITISAFDPINPAPPVTINFIPPCPL